MTDDHDYLPETMCLGAAFLIVSILAAVVTYYLT
jgi:hypothetical protein